MGVGDMYFHCNACGPLVRIGFVIDPLKPQIDPSQIDYDRDMTFVALAPLPDGQPIMVGDARAVCDPDNLQAEFAIQVASNWKGKRLGRVLMDKLIGYLKERGTTEVVGQCLIENEAMAALAREMGFTVTADALPDALTLRLKLR